MEFFFWEGGGPSMHPRGGGGEKRAGPPAVVVICRSHVGPFSSFSNLFNRPSPSVNPPPPQSGPTLGDTMPPQHQRLPEVSFHMWFVFSQGRKHTHTVCCPSKRCTKKFRRICAVALVQPAAILAGSAFSLSDISTLNARAKVLWKSFSIAQIFQSR